MLKEFYANSDLMNWPIVAMAIFLVTFLCVLAYVVAGMRGGSHLESVAALPLEEETTVAEEATDDE